MKNKTPKKHKKKLDEALSKLEKIKELGNENFVLLNPTSGKHKDYYLNYFRICNYVQLFDTLKSSYQGMYPCLGWSIGRNIGC